MPVLACNISVQPSSASGTVGGTMDFMITVEQTHRVCSVPIEDTQIYLSGMELVSETGWQYVSDMVNQKAITVRLTVEGEGLVEVVRVCSKGGDQCAATVSILPAAVAGASRQDETPVDEEAVAPSAPVDDALDEARESENATATPAIPISPASHSTPQSPTLGETITDPYIILLVALMLLGVFAVARGYRRIRPFAMLVALGFFGFYIGGCPCPIGALQNAFLYFRDLTGHMFVFVQLGVVLVMALLVGRMFCGWACPMGAVQYFLYRRDGGRKAARWDLTLEQHQILRRSKYGLLLVLIGLTVLTQHPVFEDIDPFKSLFNMDFAFGVPLVLLIILTVVSILIGFPFCKYACPLGAFLGIIQPLSIFKVKVGDGCTNCRACCDMFCDYRAIEPGPDRPTVNQRECIRCGECVARCPTGAMQFTSRR